MPDSRIVFDGHSSLFGMDGDSNPSYISGKQASKAVNRVFRGGKNDTRPAFNQINLTFANDEDKLLFETGNVQGMHPYLKTTPGRLDGVVVSVAGTIFYIALVNETGYVNRLIDGNERTSLHAFFIQVEEWMYIQDGHNPAIFWDGIATPTRSGGDAANEMPVGTIMTYSHGRVFLGNEFNEVKASDVMFGSGFTNTRNVQKFTEIDYWQEGGAFIIPSSYGQITGMITMASIGANLRGQGELVVFGENGAMSFDVNLPRLSWKDAQIQKTALIGRGNVAPNSVIGVNGDAWFKSQDGWASYSNSRLDFTSRPSFRKFSKSINNFLAGEQQELTRYASSIYFDNRILGTVQPQLSLTRIDGAGSNRYFKGIAALDLDTSSRLSGGEEINFDGLWTGIKPTEMITVRDRAFAMSYDSDGVNRLYEITKTRGDDNHVKQIRSHYYTKKLGFQPSQTSEFQRKKLIGAELWVSEISRPSGIELSFRPDDNKGWNELLPEKQIGVTDPISRRIDKYIKIGTPNIDDCRESSSELIGTAFEFQLAIEMEGNVRVDRLRIHGAEIEQTHLTGDDCSDNLVNETAILSEKIDEYGYLIV